MEIAMQGVNEIFRNAALSAALAGLVGLATAAQISNQSDNSTKASSEKTESPNASTSKGAAQLTPADRGFVQKAAEGGLAEVELGKLASEKASSDEVKKFGQRMVADHSKANDQLKQVASRVGVTLPDKLNPKDQATKDRLSKLSGEPFDAAYMRDMVKDHTKDLAEFRHESQSAKNDDVKNFAAQTLPTLQDHLQRAKSIAPKEKREARNESKGKPSPAKLQR
jgi:putative membrane protein